MKHRGRHSSATNGGDVRRTAEPMYYTSTIAVCAEDKLIGDHSKHGSFDVTDKCSVLVSKPAAQQIS